MEEWLILIIVILVSIPVVIVILIVIIVVLVVLILILIVILLLIIVKIVHIIDLQDKLFVGGKRRDGNFGGHRLRHSCRLRDRLGLGLAQRLTESRLGLRLGVDGRVAVRVEVVDAILATISVIRCIVIIVILL